MSRTITLAKGGQKYVFRYSSGSEPAVVDELIRLARSRGTGITWPDAARASFQVARTLADECPGLAAAKK